jgi:hypothetical protein
LGLTRFRPWGILASLWPRILAGIVPT